MLWSYMTGMAFLAGGQINSTIEHAAAEHGHPEAKSIGRKTAQETRQSKQSQTLNRQGAEWQLASNAVVGSYALE